MAGEVYYDNNKITLDVNNVANMVNYGYYKTASNTDGLPKHLKGEEKNGMLFWNAEDGSNKSGQQILYLTNGDIYKRNVKKSVLGNWSKIIDSVELDDKLKKSNRLFEAVPENSIRKAIHGEYAMNLFDYRVMSRDNKVKWDGKVCYTNVVEPFHNDTLLDHTSYNRCRKKDKIYIRTRLLSDLPKEDHESFNILLKNTGADNPDKLIKLTVNDGILRDDNVVYKDYGYLRFSVGTDHGFTNPQTKAEFRAWYGDFEPEGLSQKFEFKKYNNIELMAMPLYNKETGDPLTERSPQGEVQQHLYDSYAHYTYYDVLTKSLNVLNLKDVKTFRLHDDTDSGKHIIVIPIPEDCKSKPNVMSSNLCDIGNDSASGKQNKPFFLLDTGMYEFEEKGEKVQKECFQILLDIEYAYKWREHLSQTQIMYELKDKTPKQLPTGGILFTTSSGDTVRSCMYKDITVEQGAIQFLNSPFGFPDQVIFNNQLAQTTLYYNVE